jgi:hypothetical protein
MSTGIIKVGIPIYPPTKFELLINQKTAKPLALTLPPAAVALTK